MPAKDRASGSAAPRGPREFKVFGTDKSAGREMQLLTDSAFMAGFVRITLSSADTQVTFEEVLDFLQSHKVIVTTTARDEIKKALRPEIRHGMLIGPVQVAAGRPPKNGTDGDIQWLVDRPDAQGQAQGQSGKVNYRELRAITNVKQGQKILTLVDPRPGVGGQDIFGKTILCQEGRPATAKRGKNVDITADGREYFSQVAGMVQLSGDTVSVEPVYIVQGDVDMSVGNINFIGAVKIAKDVQEGFTIKAGKEIEIGGMVEGSTLEAGSFIRVNGGVTGKGKSHVICKGSFESRYLNEVFVECGGDVVVANSIINCTVKSLGRVIVTSGGIRGANVVAEKGLKTPEIGSDLGVRTVVVVGVDYQAKDSLINVEREMEALREAVEKVEAALGPLVSKGELIATLPQEKADIARRLMGQLGVLIERANALASKRDDILSGMQVSSDVFVEVTKRIYAGVILQIGSCRRTFDMEVTGPVKLHPDVETGGIKVSR